MFKLIITVCAMLLFLANTGSSADDPMNGEREAFKAALEKIKKKYKKKELHERLAQRKIAFARNLMASVNNDSKNPNVSTWKTENGKLMEEIEKHGKAGALIIMPAMFFPSRWDRLADDGILRLAELAGMPEEYDLDILLEFLNYKRVYASGEPVNFKTSAVTFRNRKTDKEGFFAKNDLIGRDYVYLFYLRSNVEQMISFEIDISKGDKIDAVYVNLAKASGKGKYKAQMREGVNLIMIIFKNTKKTDMKLQLKVKPGEAAKKKRSGKKQSEKIEPLLETPYFYAE